MAADSGNPIAPPTPRLALTNATAPPTRSAGNTSRNMLMATGITPVASPCNTRPTITGISASDTAHNTEPATSETRLPTSTLRLPYMSPSRPAIGVTTAAASKVAVITQEASDGSASRRRGSCGMIGTTSVCMSDTTTPLNAITPVTTPGPTVRGEVADNV